jgi:hypothetical protein
MASLVRLFMVRNQIKSRGEDAVLFKDCIIGRVHWDTAIGVSVTWLNLVLYSY